MRIYKEILQNLPVKITFLTITNSAKHLRIDVHFIQALFQPFQPDQIHFVQLLIQPLRKTSSPTYIHRLVDNQKRDLEFEVPTKSFRLVHVVPCLIEILYR